MKIFIITPFEGKKYYQKDIDRIIEVIESTGATVISPEKKREYLDAFREENIKGLGDQERVHYEFIREGVKNADAVVVEASYEDFRVGHETTLAILYKKPVLCLSKNIDYGKYIRHEGFRGAQYDSHNVEKLVLDFLTEVSRSILSKRSAALHIATKRESYQGISLKHIAVLGSINADMVTKVPRIPQENEMVISEGLKVMPGGKATNAAIAIARLQTRVSMIGKIGNDSWGDDVKSIIQEEGINTDFVDTDAFIPTGTVMVNVDQEGKNTLIVNEDANIRINPKTVISFLEKAEKNGTIPDCFYLTLEPLPEIVAIAVQECKKRNVLIFCDAAPQTRPLPESLYSSVDFLTPNEYEASAMTGIKVVDIPTANQATRYLRARGANTIIVTLGKLGAVLLPKGTDEPIYFPGNKVRVVDETGAGDAFRGAFVVEYLETGDLHHSVEFANKVGAFTVTRLGVYNAMPTREQLDFLEVLPR